MMHNHDEDTIVAQCTPTGAGALALIRISGIDAVAVADALCVLASRAKLKDCDTHTIHFARIVDEHGDIIDQVMVTLMQGPKTFTGQDTVEITSHNNQFIIERIIQRALACGARMASQGEFTRRAVLNDKMDLLQAEALNELIHANTQQVLKQALAQLEGSFSAWMSSLEDELVRAHAFCEASFEFIDEEMTFDVQIRQSIQRILVTIATIKRTFNAEQQIRQGIRIALIGLVNVGKSSLFNALIGAQRAIVTPQAGTTRDTIEAGLYRQGTYWTLVDTAGLRETEDVIEREGVARAYVQAEAADLLLLVIDGSRELTPAEVLEYKALYSLYSTKIISVYTKSDQPRVSYVPHDGPHLSLSNVTGEGLDTLESMMAERITLLLSQAKSPYLINQRHYHLLIGLEHQLHQIEDQLSGSVAYELLSCHLNDALAHISAMTGKTISEQTMDAIFRQFCVGK